LKKHRAIEVGGGGPTRRVLEKRGDHHFSSSRKVLGSRQKSQASASKVLRPKITAPPRKINRTRIERWVKAKKVPIGGRHPKKKASTLKIKEMDGRFGLEPEELKE